MVETQDSACVSPSVLVLFDGEMFGVVWRIGFRERGHAESIVLEGKLRWPLILPLREVGVPAFYHFLGLGLGTLVVQKNR